MESIRDKLARLFAEYEEVLHAWKMIDGHVFFGGRSDGHDIGRGWVGISSDRLLYSDDNYATCGWVNLKQISAVGKHREHGKMEIFVTAPGLSVFLQLPEKDLWEIYGILTYGGGGPHKQAERLPAVPPDA